MKEKKRILVAPLDWGLGHAARCIPIVRYLQELKHEVVIVTDGRALDLVKTEFPNTECIRLQGYSPEYPTGNNMVAKMAMQVPKFTKTIIKEHYELERFIKKFKIDGVISDNRYGLWTDKVPCVLINHQLQIIMPWHSKGIQPFVNALNRYFINRFDECWVPDFEGDKNISGTLSLNVRKRKSVVHIGILSRFEKKPAIEIAYGLLVLLSGPEPQRTILENIILRQLQGLQMKTLIVRGITEKKERKYIDENTEMVSNLGSEELNEVILKSNVVLARAGYSTIMDLLKLEKKAILIPTPGQTEQEYLAKILMRRGYFLSQRQSSFDLQHALNASKNYRVPVDLLNGCEAYKSAVGNFLKKL